jgi:hypothetical protein
LPRASEEDLLGKWQDAVYARAVLAGRGEIIDMSELVSSVFFID